MGAGWTRNEGDIAQKYIYQVNDFRILSIVGKQELFGAQHSMLRMNAKLPSVIFLVK